jgi:hypothetical protein
MGTRVKVFKGSINEVESVINEWAESNGARVLNTSMCYDEPTGFGYVFVIVVYEAAR